MWFGFLLWMLVTLLSISFLGDYPVATFVGAVLAGSAIGLYIFTRRKPGFFCSVTRHDPAVPGLSNVEIALLSGAVVLLFFANRLPVLVWVLALFLLAVFWISLKTAAGWSTTITTFDFPLALFLFAALPGLYASVDLRLSSIDFFRLIAEMALLLGLVKGIQTPKQIRFSVFVFLAFGACIVGLALFAMQFPPSKLPPVSRIYSYFPQIISRKVHFNYIGGVLTLFFPLAFWRWISGARSRLSWSVVWTGIIGFGLLLTQSRGALLGTLVALILTGAWVNRWIRWALLLLAVGGSGLVYTAGLQNFLDFLGIAVSGNSLVSRQELWSHAVHIIQDFPFTGIGFHTFPVVTDVLYPLFLAAPDARMPHAHNLYLQVAVDTGIPGFVAFWMLLGAWGGMVWDALKASSCGIRREVYMPLMLGLAGSMLAHMIYSITDAITLGEKAGIVFWAVLGLTIVVWRQVKADGEAGETAY